MTAEFVVSVVRAAKDDSAMTRVGVIHDAADDARAQSVDVVPIDGFAAINVFRVRAGKSIT